MHGTNDRDRSDRLDEAGARLYGVRWLAANEIAVSLLDSFGIPPHEHKALGRAIAIQIAVAADKGRIPAPTARRVEDAVCMVAEKREVATS